MGIKYEYKLIRGNVRYSNQIDTIGQKMKVNKIKMSFLELLKFINKYII